MVARFSRLKLFDFLEHEAVDLGEFLGQLIRRDMHGIAQRPNTVLQTARQGYSEFTERAAQQIDSGVARLAPKLELEIGK